MCSETSVATEKKYIDTFQSRRWMMSMLDRDRKRERKREGEALWKPSWQAISISYLKENSICSWQCDFWLPKNHSKNSIEFCFLNSFYFFLFFLNCSHSNFVAQSFCNKSAKLSGTISWSISQSLQSLAFIMIKSLACSRDSGPHFLVRFVAQLKLRLQSANILIEVDFP